MLIEMASSRDEIIHRARMAFARAPTDTEAEDVARRAYYAALTQRMIDDR